MTSFRQIEADRRNVRHHPFQNVDGGEAKHEPKCSPSRYEVALRSSPRSTVVSGRRRKGLVHYEDSLKAVGTFHSTVPDLPPCCAKEALGGVARDYVSGSSPLESYDVVRPAATLGQFVFGLCVTQPASSFATMPASINFSSMVQGLT